MKLKTNKYHCLFISDGEMLDESLMTDAEIARENKHAAAFGAGEWVKLADQIITPCQQLRNVAAVVTQYATPTRSHNGRGRMPSYSVDKHTIAHAALHLADLVNEYLDGKVKPVPQSDIPF